MGSDFRAVGQRGEKEAWQGGLWDEELELKAGPEKNTFSTGLTQT